jgi:hypothetical protein
MASSSAGYFKFYEPEFNPTGVGGVVGGETSSTELQPKLGYLFVDKEASELTETLQFRKLWIKQEGQGTFQDVNLNVVNIEHTGQIHFVTGEGPDSSTTALSYPTGAYGQLATAHFSGNVDTPMYIGSTVQNDEFSVWIRQSIPAGSSADSLSSFSFQVKGTKIT